MDYSQEETKSKKIVLGALVFLVALILGIILANLFFRSKTEKNQNQAVTVQKPASIINPAPSNVQSPSNPSVQKPSNLPGTTAPSDKEKTTAPPNVPEPSNSSDFTTPSNNGKIPPPLP